MALTVGTDTYADLDFAESYFSSRPHSSAWTNLVQDSDKEAALKVAAKVIDLEYEWKGSPTNSAQAMAWPRTGMLNFNGSSISSDSYPNLLKEAQCEMAYQWLQADQLSPNASFMTSSDTDTLNGGVKSKQIGDMKVEYNSYASYISALNQGYGFKKSYPFIDLMLRPFVRGKSSGVYRTIAR